MSQGPEKHKVNTLESQFVAEDTLTFVDLILSPWKSLLPEGEPVTS